MQATLLPWTELCSPFIKCLGPNSTPCLPTCQLAGLVLRTEALWAWTHVSTALEGQSDTCVTSYTALVPSTLPACFRTSVQADFRVHSRVASD